ncbi:MAG: hypothetical protein Q8P22_05320 [Chloroflexota bacterium]|nr:hypothetical protein [Chloroflexota bacterium]
MDLRRDHDSKDVSDADGLTAQMLEWARERVGQERGTTPAVRQTSEGTKAKARGNVIVVALHEGTDDWGEAHLFEDVQAAGRFVQALLEGGVDEGRLTVFSTAPIGVVVSYRPVVELKRPEKEADAATQAKPA